MFSGEALPSEVEKYPYQTLRKENLYETVNKKGPGGCCT